jgi:hypothetical protein
MQQERSERFFCAYLKISHENTGVIFRYIDRILGRTLFIASQLLLVAENNQ